MCIRDRISIIPQQLIDLQQTYHIGILYDIQMACGRNRSTDAIHRQRQDVYKRQMPTALFGI